MPNHITTIVELSGDEQEVREVFESLKSEETDFDLDKIIQMPKELLGADTTYGKKDNKLLIQLYGSDNWYDWNIKNWGTKWNTYECFLVDDWSIEFQTAWSTPAPAIQELSRQYPDIEIKITFADEDIGSNCGILTYKAGEEIDWQDMSVANGTSQEESIKFALNVKYGSDEDYEDYIYEQEE